MLDRVPPAGLVGTLELRQITPEPIARWQADRLASGAGRVSIRHAFDLLGSVLQRAFEGVLVYATTQLGQFVRLRAPAAKKFVHWRQPTSKRCAMRAVREMQR